MTGNGPEATLSLSSRVEALLRSLVGVTAGEVCLGETGIIERVRVVSDGTRSSGQVVQNVRSAVLAGVGAKLKVAQVELVPELPATAGDALTADLAPAPPPPVAESAHHNDGAPIQRIVPVAAASFEPLLDMDGGLVAVKSKRKRATVMMLDTVVADIVDMAITVQTVELVRQAGRIRCRVVLAVNTDRFSAVADAAEDTVAEIQLAGRVTTDALRAGNLTAATFDGATVAYLASRVHVVVALTEWRHGEPVQLTGSAVVHQTLEEAAAHAVLQALQARR